MVGVDPNWGPSPKHLLKDPKVVWVDIATWSNGWTFAKKTEIQNGLAAFQVRLVWLVYTLQLPRRSFCPMCSTSAFCSTSFWLALSLKPVFLFRFCRKKACKKMYHQQNGRIKTTWSAKNTARSLWCVFYMSTVLCLSCDSYFVTHAAPSEMESEVFCWWFSSEWTRTSGGFNSVIYQFAGDVWMSFSLL